MSLIVLLQFIFGNNRTEKSKYRKKIFKALIDSVIIHEKFVLVINEEQNYRSLNESSRTNNSQLGDIERDRLMEHGKRIGIDEILREGETQNLNLKYKIKSLEIIR